MVWSRRQVPESEGSLYDYAIGSLARRMRSVAELKRALRRRVGEAPDGETLIDRVVARLKEHRYLDDERYASAYTTLRKENDKLGRRRVASDLRSRGIHPEMIERTVAVSYSDVDEAQQARAYLKKKRIHRPSDARGAARIFRALVRAGFSASVIFVVLKKWDVEDEVLSVLESELESQAEG